jgi:hypothetical protein
LPRQKKSLSRQKRGAPLRLIGALAFHLHCPEYNYIHKKWGRVFTDTDFVARSEHSERSLSLLTLIWATATMK